jgi:hypothetical protein
MGYRDSARVTEHLSARRTPGRRSALKFLLIVELIDGIADTPTRLSKTMYGGPAESAEAES